jgi:hypothetical protein
LKGIDSAACPKQKLVDNWFEDFNSPKEVTLPPLPVTVVGQSDADCVRREAWNEGYLAASRAISRDFTHTSETAMSDFLARAQQYDQKLAGQIEEHATAIAAWLAGVMVAIFPIEIPPNIKGLADAAGQLPSDASRAVGSVRVQGEETTVLCDTFEEAWRHIATRMEYTQLHEMSFSWQAGDARIGAARIWHTLSDLMLKPLVG